MWKLIKTVLKYKEIRILIVAIADAWEDKKLTKEEKKDLINKIAAVLTSFVK